MQTIEKFFSRKDESHPFPRGAKRREPTTCRTWTDGEHTVIATTTARANEAGSATIRYNHMGEPKGILRLNGVTIHDVYRETDALIHLVSDTPKAKERYA